MDINVLLIICLAAMLLFVIYAVMADSTFKSAVGLACASVALGILMYFLDSPWAALFEISVCSGFVTVIFVSAVAMTSQTKEEQDKIYDQKEAVRWLPLLMIVILVLLVLLFGFSGFDIGSFTASPQTEDDFGTVLWTQHKDLLFGLLLVLLAGAFAVVVLFKDNAVSDAKNAAPDAKNTAPDAKNAAPDAKNAAADQSDAAVQKKEKEVPKDAV